MRIVKNYFQYIVFSLMAVALPLVSFTQTKSQKDSSFFVYDSIPQTDLIDLFKYAFSIKSKKKPREKRKIYYSVLPIGMNIPGGGKALFTTTSAGFYLGNRKTTAISSATFTPMWNLRSRFSFTLRSNIWTRDNKWNILGDTRYLIYPQYTWGIGKTDNQNNRILVDYRYFRFYQTVMKKVTKTTLAGIGYHIDNAINITTSNDTLSLQQFTGYSYGTATGKTTLSSGLSVNLLEDSRGNPINPQKGLFTMFTYKYYPKFLGSNDNWQSLYIDVRKYLRFGNHYEQNLLGLWGYYWTVTQGNPPYLDLPSNGWDPYSKSGRCYDQSRFRGKSIFYTEAEYRKDITHNGLFGFVAFMQMLSVSDNKINKFQTIYPGVGAGLRIKFNKKSRTNIAIDYGFGLNNSRRFFLGLGETF